MATDHRKLSAFNLADELTVRLYKATVNFPASERYGLQSQLRRAAVSIATNIVEGCAREIRSRTLTFLRNGIRLSARGYLPDRLVRAPADARR